jgi:hypothetical protein
LSTAATSQQTRRDQRGARGHGAGFELKHCFGDHDCNSFQMGRAGGKDRVSARNTDRNFAPIFTV